MSLDIEQPAELTAYLHKTGKVSPGEELRIQTLAGGVSNKTVLVETGSGKAWVLKQALAKLRVKVDWFSDPARIEREAEGIRWLEKLAPKGSITPLVFEDRQHHLLAMEAVRKPHENWKTLLLNGQIDPQHMKQFGELLGTIHRRGWEQRSELSTVFADRSFFESLRIEPYYQYSATQVPEAAEFLKALIADTLKRRLSIVHGDYSPKNVLVYQGRLILLDHEVIHFGDPAFDLGFSLAHLLSKAHHVKPSREAFAKSALDYWQTYTSALGDVPWRADLESFAVRHTLACLLARVSGRSTLEYLDQAERKRQRDAVINLASRELTVVKELIDVFLKALREY
jgi:aminoglycoside phosphotransferase (APT) family kinase protein